MKNIDIAAVLLTIGYILGLFEDVVIMIATAIVMGLGSAALMAAVIDWFNGVIV